MNVSVGSWKIISEDTEAEHEDCMLILSPDKKVDSEWFSKTSDSLSTSGKYRAVRPVKLTVVKVTKIFCLS